MFRTYRIHGDNIVECERIAKIIINTLRPKELGTYLISPSTIAIEFNATYFDTLANCRLELLPGFNKNTKKHWEKNIFDALKEAGSYLDETPDAIITKIDEEGNENILLAIEFCSALQAGNQAWQRSGRAFSTGRAGCPYLYIVDFVKYELDNKTRERKNLRFPNAAVPYSYVSYTKTHGNMIAQLYIKSEEFNKIRDSDLKDFDESNFGNHELGVYIVKLMLGMNTHKEEQTILEKNMNVVKFLAGKTDANINFTANDWDRIFYSSSQDIVEYAVDTNRFGFHKTIATKSQHGQSEEIIKLVDRLGVGFASKDLPFGIIPAGDRPAFSKSLEKIYPAAPASASVMASIASTEKNLVIAIFKGFKPKGDDNRPDRGLLPLVSMLSNNDVDVMTYIYGPIIEKNLILLDSNPQKLAEKNGLWCSILALTNYLLLDVPVLASSNYGAERLYDFTALKRQYNNIGFGKTLQAMPVFSSVPVHFGEDDVDTGIHYFFSHLLGKHCFEGMCNPPGGDWSGFSVIDKGIENRWLSLPRVSDFVNGKRPDHILQLFGVFDKPLLLSVESKECSTDLETDVGTKLVTYIKELMNYTPSAKRQRRPLSAWEWGDRKVCFDDFETLSAAAYLKKYAEPSAIVFKKNCEILFVMNPVLTERKIGWEIEIIPSTKRSQILKDFIIKHYNATRDSQFIIK